MSFANDIQKFSTKSKLSMDLVVRKVTFDISRAIIRRSPVATGRFRGNWMLGVGAVDPTTNIQIQDMDGTGSTNRILSGLNSVKAGGVVYVTNSLPYAIPLEFGHSKQAPQGMVRLTVAEYKTYIENAVRDIK